MSRNAHSLKLIRSLGMTPGFAMEPQEKGRYKLLRLAIDKYDVKEASVTVSANAADRQHQNDISRIRSKLGWTMELFERMGEIARQHRIADTDPADDQLKALLVALDIDPSAPDTAPDDRPQQKRHGKGGSATGSARVAAGTAQPAAQPEQPLEAPVQLLEDVGRMQAEVISPERALDLLTRLAPYQRKPDDKKVRDYAGAITRGEWKLNPADPLCIDTNNMTCNGAHRLHACVEAEIPIQCWVAYDVAPGTYDVMDRGKKRSTADMLYGAGEVNTSRLATLGTFAHLWFNYDQDQWAAAPKVSEAQVLAILEAHPGMRVSAKSGHLTKLSTSTSAAMLAHYLITRKMGGDDRLVTAWYKAIQTMDLNRGDPGHTLGLHYLGTANRRRIPLQGRTRRDLDMYLIMQAWNNTCLGKEVRRVSYDAQSFVIPEPLTPREGTHIFPPFD